MSDRSRYFGGQVTCVQRAGGATFTTAPVVLFEVFSAGDEKRNRVDKVMATVIERNAQGWNSFGIGRERTLRMPEIGLAFPLPELNDGVAFG